MKNLIISLFFLGYFYPIMSQIRCDTSLIKNSYSPYEVCCIWHDTLISKIYYGQNFELRSAFFYQKDSIIEKVYYPNRIWEICYVEIGVNKQKKGTVIIQDSLSNIIAKGLVLGTWIDTFELYTFYPNQKIKEHYFQEGHFDCKVGVYESFYPNGNLACRGNYDYKCDKIGYWETYNLDGKLISKKRPKKPKYESIGHDFYIQKE